MTVKQTFIKTASYACMHMTLSIGVAYALSGDWCVALAIGLVEPCVQTVGFFFHERFWHRLERKKHQKDYHDSVIDSTSPATGPIERFLHRHKNRRKKIKRFF